MHIVYPLLWSRLGRQACREQSVSTAAALARRGVEVTLSMPRLAGDPALTADEIRAYYDVEGDFRLVQRPGRWASEKFVPSVLRIREALADPALAGADLLYSRIPAMLAFGRYSPVPFVTDHYRPWPDDLPWIRPIVRGTAHRRHCLGFVLHSDFTAQSYRRAGVPNEQLLVAHNGADPRRMLPRLAKAEARSRLRLARDRPIALYSGRLNLEKGLDKLLAVAALRPDILFLLVGSEGDGPIERSAARLANVRIVPWQAPDALPAWLHAADVLVVPPASAPLRHFHNCVLPMKIFPYLAAGRAILAPRAPDTAELLRDGDTALLVPPDDPEAAAAGLDRLIADTALARDLGENGRLLAKGLSWDDRAERISAFLERRLEAIRSGAAPVRPLSALRI